MVETPTKHYQAKLWNEGDSWMLAERAAHKDGEVRNVLLAARGNMGSATEETLRRLVMARAAFYERFQEADRAQMDEAAQKRYTSLSPDQVAGALGMDVSAVTNAEAPQTLGASVGRDGKREKITGRLFQVETPDGSIAIADGMFL